MIDADSILMIASLVGLGMSPLWAKWSNMALLKFKLSKGAHVAGVVCLSLLALALFYIGPWVFLIFLHDRLQPVLADQKTPLGFLIFFGLGVVWQTVQAISEALRSHKN